MADDQLRQVDCSPQCGFRVRSHDEEEVVEITKKHGKTKHDLNWSDDDIKHMMKPA